jgi:hypothetical protein
MSSSKAKSWLELLTTDFLIYKIKPCLITVSICSLQSLNSHSGLPLPLLDGYPDLPSTRLNDLCSDLTLCYLCCIFLKGSSYLALWLLFFFCFLISLAGLLLGRGNWAFIHLGIRFKGLPKISGIKKKKRYVNGIFFKSKFNTNLNERQNFNIINKQESILI